MNTEKFLLTVVVTIALIGYSIGQRTKSRITPLPNGDSYCP